MNDILGLSFEARRKLNELARSRARAKLPLQVRRQINSRFAESNAVAATFDQKSIILNVMLPLCPRRLKPPAPDALLPSTEYQSLTAEAVDEIARRFKNEFAKFALGRRIIRQPDRLAKLTFSAMLHKEKHDHLHIVIELPADSRRTLEEACEFVKSYSRRDRWVAQKPYCEMATDVPRSISYNSRVGSKTVF